MLRDSLVEQALQPVRVSLWAVLLVDSNIGRAKEVDDLLHAPEDLPALRPVNVCAVLRQEELDQECAGESDGRGLCLWGVAKKDGCSAVSNSTETQQLW